MPTSTPRTLTLVALLAWLPLNITAGPKSKADIALASVTGRLWVLALVDCLHDQKQSAPERKAIYALYLRQQLNPIGSTSPEELLQAITQGVEHSKKALGEERLEAITRDLRNPYQKPFVDGSQVEVSEPEKKAIQEFFNLNYTAGNTGVANGTPDSLTMTNLGSVMVGNMKVCLDGWTSGRVVTEASNAKLYQLVDTSLRTTIARLSEDETIINEAWKEVVAGWLKE